MPRHQLGMVSQRCLCLSGGLDVVCISIDLPENARLAVNEPGSNCGTAASLFRLGGEEVWVMQ